MARTVTVTAADVDVFHVAAAQMGDALQWWRIMAANALTNPVIAGTLTLTIPIPNAALSGGVPPQS